MPGAGDDRTLGVAVSRLHMADATLEPRRWAGERFPWLLRDPTDLEFLGHYERVLANSQYTRHWIRRLWGVDSDVLFPPVRTRDLHPGPKARRILTVGRFIAPGFGHSKKQLEQVKAFGQMVRGGGLDGWELHLVGGCEPAHRPYLAEVERAARAYRSASTPTPPAPWSRSCSPPARSSGRPPGWARTRRPRPGCSSTSASPRWRRWPPAASRW